MFIGSCTNSRIEDLRAAAKIVAGRKVASTLRAMVVPGSQQVKAQAEREGLDAVFRDGGFEWRESGCSMCLGMNPDILAAAGALRVDVQPELRRTSGTRRPHASVQPGDGRGRRDRGPLRRHQGLELTMEPVRNVEGKISPLDRADVDTDQIIPKQFLKRIERTGFGEFLFYDWVRDGEVTLEDAPVLVAGKNFGCGSSREHAVWAIQQAGFKAVIAPSFGDIFYNNASKNGLLTIALPEEDVKVLMNAEGCAVDLEAQLVTFGGRVVPFDIDPDIKHRLLNGLDDIAITLAERRRDRHLRVLGALAAPSTTSLF